MLMNRQESANSVTHFKMYKSGRKWMFAGITALTMLTATGAVAHADDGQSAKAEPQITSVTPNSNSVADSSAVDNSSAVASATTAESSAATNSSAATSTSTLSASAVVASSSTASSQPSSASSAKSVAEEATTTMAMAATIPAQQNNGVDLSSLHFSNNARCQNFIQSVAPGAVAGWNKYQVLPSITVAQAILESGWGQSSLSTNAHNLFGIKGSYNGHSVTMRTREVYGGRSVYINDNFRAYDNNSESVEDHGNFLYSNRRYHNLLGDTNYVSVARKLRQDGYATDPSYANSLIRLVQTYNLNQLDSVAFSGRTITNKDTDTSASDTNFDANGNTNYYTVHSGDTLSGIANKFNTTYTSLAQINHLSNPNRIYVGQRLQLRAQATSQAPTTNTNSQSQRTNNNSTAATYTVQSGGTLSGIAAKFNTTYTQLAQTNHLSNPNQIYVGQRLQVRGNSQVTHQSSSVSHVSAGNTGYIVQSGDSLSKIAAQYGLNWRTLASKNNLQSPYIIYVGQHLAL